MLTVGIGDETAANPEVGVGEVGDLWGPSCRVPSSVPCPAVAGRAYRSVR